MATHDYEIANGTGGAVRSDLNNVLAAIRSNNSSSSEPAVKFAYMWWADTNDNVLKMRNSANNGWITLRELDGTMLLEDGSAGSPAIAFRDDTNTGMFSGAADELNFSTGGAERFKLKTGEVVVNDPSNNVDFRVESNNRTHMLFVDGGTDCVGIGVSNPGDFSTKAETLVIANGGDHVGMTFDCDTDKEGSIFFADGGSGDNLFRGQIVYNHSGDTLRFVTNASERARIDSTGRLLLGLTSRRSNFFNASDAPRLQLESTEFVGSAISCVRDVNSSAAGGLVLGKTRGTSIGSNTVVQSGDSLGQVSFQGADGSEMVEAAKIAAEIDGTPGANDMPGRIVFRTTGDGSSSSTERMRIKHNGRVGIGTSTPESLLEIAKTAGANDNTDLRIKTFRPGIRFIDISTNADDAEIVMDSDALRFRISDETDADTALTERMRLTNSGKLFVGDSSGDGDVEARGTAGIISRSSSSQTTDNNKAFIARNNSGTDMFHVSYRGQGFFTRDVRFNQNSTDTPGSGNTTLGACFEYLGNDGTALFVSRSGNLVANFNRAQDGTVVQFSSAGNAEGNILISGSTTSYNGGHLTRWSQLAGGAERIEILPGSVLSNLDEMCVWAHAAQDEVLWTAEDELPEGVSVGDVKTPARDAYTENNEQLNRMKVSDVEGDTNVAGVFQIWDDDDDTFTNDFYCAMTGDFIIRIAQGTTVARGDLLMSAGDGTAKPQDDDIVRSKTVAKVTSTTVSTTYADGSYCVPCVLMAC
mgnify:CR=1 FL=1